MEIDALIAQHPHLARLNQDVNAAARAHGDAILAEQAAAKASADARRAFDLALAELRGV